MSKEQYFKARLFTYPETAKSSTVFDDDDLQQENALLVLCVRAQPEKDIDEDTVHVWRGYEFEATSAAMDEDLFVEKVIKAYFGPDCKRDNIKIVEEEPGEESDEFLNHFD